MQERALLARVTKYASLIFAVFLLAGCVSITDQSQWDWQLDPTVTAVDWDSGKDQGLPISTVDCSSITGNEHSLISGLSGFKDRTSATNRFIARLLLDCTAYVQFGGHYIQGTTPAVTTQITSNLTFDVGNGERPIAIASRDVPIGIAVIHNRKNFVHNLQIIYGTEDNGVITDYVNWYDNGAFTPATISDWESFPIIVLATATQPKSTSLLCPSQSVITGVRIREKPSNGKIRFLGIDCQQLSNN